LARHLTTSFLKSRDRNMFKLNFANFSISVNKSRLIRESKYIQALCEFQPDLNEIDCDITVYIDVIVNWYGFIQNDKLRQSYMYEYNYKDPLGYIERVLFFESYMQTNLMLRHFVVPILFNQMFDEEKNIFAFCPLFWKIKAVNYKLATYIFDNLNERYQDVLIHDAMNTNKYINKKALVYYKWLDKEKVHYVRRPGRVDISVFVDCRH